MHDDLGFLRELLDVDEPIVVRVRHELEPESQQLLAALGVGYIIDPVQGIRCAKLCGRPECRVRLEWEPPVRPESPQMRRKRENEERRRAAAANGHAEPDGLDLLERMDAGLPLVDEEPELDEVPVLEEVAAVADSSVSGAASVDRGEPERAATSSSTVLRQSHTPALDRWPREAIIAALQTWAASHGGVPPSSTEWGKAAADHPNSVLVKRVFGSWADAVEIAGFPRPRRGVKPVFLASPAGAPAPTPTSSEREPQAAEPPAEQPSSSQSTAGATAPVSAHGDRPLPSPSRSEDAAPQTPDQGGAAAAITALAAAARTFADTLEQLLADTKRSNT